jgi:hypothetical protein
MAKIKLKDNNSKRQTRKLQNIYLVLRLHFSAVEQYGMYTIFNTVSNNYAVHLMKITIKVNYFNSFNV